MAVLVDRNGVFLMAVLVDRNGVFLMAVLVDRNGVFFNGCSCRSLEKRLRTLMLVTQMVYYFPTSKSSR